MAMLYAVRSSLVRAAIALLLLAPAARTPGQCTSPPVLYEIGGASKAICNATFNHQALSRGRFVQIVQSNVTPPVVRSTLALDNAAVHMHTEIVGQVWAVDRDTVYGLVINDPANPQIVGRLKLPVGTGTLLRVRAKGSYVYASSVINMFVVDISNPAAPVLRSTFTPARVGNAPTGIYDLQVVGSYAYLAGSGSPESSAPTLVVVNIADPTQPAEVSRVGAGQAYSLALPPGGGFIYALVGFSGASSGLQRWSLANPVTPVLQAINNGVSVGSLDELVVTNNVIVQLQNQFLAFGRVCTYDVTTLALRGSSGVLPGVNAIAVEQPRVLVAEDFGGMDTINIADPSLPVTTVRTLGVAPGEAWRIAGDGGGYLVVTQAYAGMSFFDTTAAGPPRLIAHIMPTNTGWWFTDVTVVGDIAFVHEGNNSIPQYGTVRAYQVTVGANPSVILRGSHAASSYIWGMDAGTDQNNVRRVYYTTGAPSGGSTLHILNATNLASMTQSGSFALTQGVGSPIKFIPNTLFPQAPTRILASDDFGSQTQIVSVASAAAPSSLGVIPEGAGVMAFASGNAWLCKNDTVRCYSIGTPATPALLGTAKVCRPGERVTGFRFTDPLAGTAALTTTGGRVVRLTTGNPSNFGAIQIAQVAPAAYGITYDGSRTHVASWTSGLTVMNSSYSTPPVEHPGAPVSGAMCPGGPTTLQAPFVASPVVISFRWYRAGLPLSDGPTGTGSSISGSATPVLTINNGGPSDNGPYFCRATNDCGAGDSSTATLSYCYPNCDCSAAAPALNVQDFACFLQKYAAVDAYANCDGSTQAPTLNVSDFTCFLQKYAAGCP